MRTIRGAIFALFSLGLAVSSVPARATPAPTILWSFCSAVRCTDGAHPTAGVSVDRSGTAFGTTAGDLYTGISREAGGSTFFAVGPEMSALFGSSYYRIVNFCSELNCTDGAEAASSIVHSATHASLEATGTTAMGGANNGGEIFKSTVDLRTHETAVTVLHAFCSKTDSYSTCADGDRPGDIVIDATGAAIYGTTMYGGMNAGSKAAGLPHGGGVLYQFDVKGGLRVLHTFCSKNDSQLHRECLDGAFPVGRQLVLDRDAKTLYGTASRGGLHKTGIVFSYNLGTHQFAILKHFCQVSGCIDGAFPQAGLTMDPATHILYGTTERGGNHGHGIIYSMGPGFRAVYHFCQISACADGSKPGWAPTPDGNGNLIGATPVGGPKNSGVLYKLSNIGADHPTMHPLYSFCSQVYPPSNCTDGSRPSGPLTLFPGTPTGTGINWTTIYGTTETGGAHTGGTVFSFTP